MQLMETCFDKLKNSYGPIPERILGKMAVAVSVNISISRSVNGAKIHLIGPLT